MVGGLFYDNYPAGTGLVSGATFGRIAGRNAAGWTRWPAGGTAAFPTIRRADERPMQDTL